MVPRTGKGGSGQSRQSSEMAENPHSDAAQYKAYGNSVAVPCVFFVLAGIAWAENRGDEA